MTSQPDQGPASSYPARGIAGLVVANSSLILAILIYMGWAYDNALFGYFHLSTLDLGFGPLEYALRSLSLFSPDIVIAAVALIAIMSVRTWGGPGTVITAIARAPIIDACRRLLPANSTADRSPGDHPPAAARRPAVSKQWAGQLTKQTRIRAFLTGAGVVLTISALALYWSATQIRISTFLVLGLLGTGPVLLTWPTRANRPGRNPYAFAIVITALCTLWAASVYAEQQGTQAARNLIRDLPTHRPVVIYSTQQLALNGPGVSATPLPPGSPYHYRYLGLRLLLIQSGTYYLLPVNWTPQMPFTYIVNESDQIRIDLY